MGRAKSSIPLTSSPTATMPPATISRAPRSSERLALPAASGVAPGLVHLLGRVEERQPAVGVLRGALDVLLAQRRDVDRDRRTLGLGQHLQRLAEAEALVRREGQREHLAVVLDRLPADHRPDDLHHLAGAGERLVVGHAVPALDDLRTRGAETQDRAASGDVVEAGGCRRERAGGARVDVEDRGADLQRLRLRGEVAHERGGVEAVDLCDPHRVQAGLLEGDDLVGGFTRVPVVHQGH